MTKEIRLTHELIELFIKYKIPSDLLSFDEKMSDGNTPTARLAVVKEHVKNMLSLISESKASEITEIRQEAAYNNLLGPPVDNYDATWSKLEKEVLLRRALTAEVSQEIENAPSIGMDMMKESRPMSTIRSLFMAKTPAMPYLLQRCDQEDKRALLHRDLQLLVMSRNALMSHINAKSYCVVMLQ